LEGAPAVDAEGFLLTMGYDSRGNYHHDFTHAHIQSVPRAELASHRNRAISSRDANKASWQGDGGTWQGVSNQSLSLLPDHLTHHLRAKSERAGGAQSGGAQHARSHLDAHSLWLQEQKRVQAILRDAKATERPHTPPKIGADSFMDAHVKQAAALAGTRARISSESRAPSRPGDWKRVSDGPVQSVLEHLYRCFHRCIGTRTPNLAQTGLFGAAPRGPRSPPKPGWGSGSSSFGKDSFLMAHVQSVETSRSAASLTAHEVHSFSPAYGSDSYMLAHSAKTSTLASQASRAKPPESRAAEVPSELRAQGTFSEALETYMIEQSLESRAEQIAERQRALKLASSAPTLETTPEELEHLET
jgi:hypothetical protein